MTDPEPTSEQETHVRRLLAQARHTEPIPSDVAARIDDALAVEAAHGPVVDLAAARRRRVRTLLVAAAAVVVLGAGVGQVLDETGGLGGSDTAADTADAGADDATRALGEESAKRESGADADSFASGGTLSDSAPPSASVMEAPADTVAPAYRAGEIVETPVDVVAVAAPRFGRVVERLRELPGVPVGDDVAIGLRHGPRYLCEPAPWGAGVLVAVRYRDQPAVLAYRAPTGQVQVVDLLQCGTGDVLRSTSIAIP